MKKFTFLLSILLIPCVLAGCASGGSTTQLTRGVPLPAATILSTNSLVVPTSTLTLAATIAISPTMTQTLKVTETPVPTVTPTLLATLNSVSVKETMETLLQDPMNCAETCFWGIIPGKTSMDQTKAFFGVLGFIPFEGWDPQARSDFYTIEYTPDNGLKTSVTLYSYNNLVENIQINPRIAMQKEGSPRDWIAYSPETLIKKYGKPSRVEFALDWGPNFVIILNMYFDSANLIVSYSGYNMIPGRPHSPMLCPLTAPFDHVRLWLGESPPNPPFYATIPLEKATSLTLDQFSQLMLGKPQQACFVVNGDAFP